MAVLQKLGYKQTGKSEPFNTDATITGILLANAILEFDGFADDAKNVIDNAMRIENTVHRNQVTFATLSAVGSASATEITIYENGTQTLRIGDVFEFDNTGLGTNNYVYAVTAIDGVTLTIAPAIDEDIPAGTTVRTTGRVLDVGDGTLGTDSVTAGNKVQVDVSPVGTYSLSAT